MAKRFNWLDEVREDAKFNYLRRLREQQELEAHEEHKKALAEGRAPAQEVSEQKDVKKPLQQMNKAELLELAEAEGVDVPEGATNPELVAAIREKRKETE